MKNQTINLKDVLNIKDSISDKFHKKTSIKNISANNIPYDEWPVSWKKINYKEYPRFKKIKLEPNTISDIQSFIHIIKQRRSERNFDTNRTIDFKTISQLLYLSSKINHVNKDGQLALRSWPSAGARYPLELYILNSNLAGIDPNYSFHYNVKRNILEKMFPIQTPKKIFVEATGQNWTKNASCIFVITAVFNRTKIKYGDRGYRYCLLDCGHFAQNILLASTYLKLKSCPIGGFSDKIINDCLDIDGSGEGAIYLIAIGK